MIQNTQPIALITGGSSGLGLAMASQLAQEGYTPIILARHKERWVKNLSFFPFRSIL